MPLFFPAHQAPSGKGYSEKKELGPLGSTLIGKNLESKYFPFRNDVFSEVQKGGKTVWAKFP